MHLKSKPNVPVSKMIANFSAVNDYIESSWSTQTENPVRVLQDHFTLNKLFWISMQTSTNHEQNATSKNDSEEAESIEEADAEDRNETLIPARLKSREVSLSFSTAFPQHHTSWIPHDNITFSRYQDR